MTLRKLKSKLEDRIYRQAFVDALYDRSKELLCSECSRLLESDTLDRYKVLVAKRREDLSAERLKLQKQKGVESRRRELERQNKENHNQN